LNPMSFRSPEPLNATSKIARFSDFSPTTKPSKRRPSPARQGPVCYAHRVPLAPSSLNIGERTMSQTVVPMIHVPDVSATVDWYMSIGFKVIRQNEEDGKTNWAKLSFGSSEIMLDAGGKPSRDHRREVDLYITTDNVDDLYRRLKDRVQVVEGLYDAFYGMREFIIRDINGFWVTFAQPVQM
jgi:uncharacterized glyoxalase superfamily protein PhnB